MDIKDFINKSITKKFSTRAKGYDPDEVDHELDNLILKIKEIAEQNKLFQHELENKNKEILELKKEREGLKARINATENTIEELTKSGYHNEAIFRRLSKLEDEAAKSKGKNQEDK